MLLHIFFSLSLLSCLAAPAWAVPNAPHEIAGFRLGTSIDGYNLTAYRNFLKQVIIEDINGFRKGIISYGVCERPGEIVKLKLKYKDSSRGFYKKLLKRFTKKFGEPDEFKGDAFGIVIAWKWHFTDKNNNRISLLLQYNQKNPDESMGNTVKLTMPDRIEAERACFIKMCNLAKTAENQREKDRSPDWKHLIPQ